MTPPDPSFAPPAVGRAGYHAALAGLLDHGCGLLDRLQQQLSATGTADTATKLATGDVEAWLKCLRLLEQTGHAHFDACPPVPEAASAEEAASPGELMTLFTALQTHFGARCE